MSADKSTDASNDYRIKPGSGWSGAWKKAAAVGVFGFALAGFGFTQDAKRFAFSYLFAFFFFLSLALGALFFVVVQHLTKAGWSVTVRRTAEFFMAGLPAFAVLIIPLIALMAQLFPWLAPHAAAGHGASTHAEIALIREAHAADLHAPQAADSHAPRKAGPSVVARVAARDPEAALEAAKAHEHAKLIEGKKSYLNKPFFLARNAFYIVVWAALAYWFFKNSTDQDRTKSRQATVNAQTWSPLALALFALTLTFASVDWLMSLNPTWFSTIFGVQVFAGSVVSALAVLILVTMSLRDTTLKGAINVEHYHDIGKLLFGFNCFWAYISFSQFFLIWYANIPEELAYFHMRWSENGGTWQGVTAALPILHFAIPFWLLLSRNVKRNAAGLVLGSVLLLVVQVLEMYWNILPNFGPFAPHWLDLACFLGVGGAYLAVVFHRMENFPLVPVGDPRLARALHFENA